MASQTQLPKTTMITYKEFFERMQEENLILTAHLTMRHIYRFDIDETTEYTVVGFIDKNQLLCLLVLFNDDFEYETFTSLHALYKWLGKWYEKSHVSKYIDVGGKWIYSEAYIVELNKK